MRGDRGVALILALLVLSFLFILGGALLTTSTIDIWISDNYKTSVQSLYLAEAGIEDARELLRTSPHTPAELAGADPIISSRELFENGHYTVWLRNANEMLTLISEGQIGSSKKTIEAVIQKAGFPESADDPRLGNLNALADAIANNANDVYAPQAITDYGSPADYKVVVVNGNADLGPGTGYGVLLVRGDIAVSGNFTWNGLVVCTGTIHWNGFSGTVNGGLHNAGAFTISDVGEIRKANRRFPYNPVSIRER